MAQKKGRVSSIEKDGWAMVVTEKGDAGLISKRQTAGTKLTPVITRIIKPTEGFHLSQIQAGLRYK